MSATSHLPQSGNPVARRWLAQYLMGKPVAREPTPMNIVVQLNGADPVVDQLTKQHLDRFRYPILHQNDDLEAAVNAMLADELTQRLPQAAKATASATTGNPATPAELGLCRLADDLAKLNAVTHRCRSLFPTGYLRIFRAEFTGFVHRCSA